MFRDVRYGFLFLLVGLTGVSGFHTEAQQSLATPNATLAANQPIYWFDWSDDGTKIAVATVSSISIYDSSFHLLVSRPQPDPTGLRSFGSLSPDGTRLATANEVWDTTTLQSLFKLDTEYPLGDWNNDGSLISGVALGAKAIVICDGSTGRLIKTIPTGDFLLLSNPHWSPDNTRFAFKTIEKKLIIVDVSQGKISESYSNEFLIDSGLSWSHDSREIAYDALPEPKLGDSGKSIAHSVYVIDATNGKIIQTFTGLQDGVHQLLWNPSDTELLSVSGFGQINVWDTNSKELISSYKTPSYLLVGIDYSPYSGQVMMAFNLNRDISSPIRNSFIGQAVFAKNVLGNTVQVFVTTPSLEKLHSISQTCGLPSHIEQSITAHQLQTFTTQVLDLTDAQIPAGCKADLLAVAEALMTKAQ